MKNYFFLSFVFSFTLLSAQEVVSNLISNPILSETKFIKDVNKSVLGLPFFDDFSYDRSIASIDLWEKSSIFVNRSYPLNPPTIGVATFDGLDRSGLARDFNPSNITDPSDTLLSKEIDLSGSNSVYLMFYYQAKGMGDAPELQDKLCLLYTSPSPRD